MFCESWAVRLIVTAGGTRGVSGVQVKEQLVMTTSVEVRRAAPDATWALGVPSWLQEKVVGVVWSRGVYCISSGGKQVTLSEFLRCLSIVAIA